MQLAEQYLVTKKSEVPAYTLSSIQADFLQLPPCSKPNLDASWMCKYGLMSSSIIFVLQHHLSLDLVLMLLQQTVLAWYISDTLRVVYDLQCAPELNRECASDKCHNAGHCKALDA